MVIGNATYSERGHGEMIPVVFAAWVCQKYGVPVTGLLRGRRGVTRYVAITCDFPPDSPPTASRGADCRGAVSDDSLCARTRSACGTGTSAGQCMLVWEERYFPTVKWTLVTRTIRSVILRGVRAGSPPFGKLSE